MSRREHAATGITGAADAILIAKRARNTAEAVLHVTGRDVTEQEYGLSWHTETCSWSLLDEPAAIATMGSTRRTILAHLTEHPGDGPQQIAARTGLNLNTVKSNVRRMVEDDQLDSDGEGRYFPRATATSATPATDPPAGLHGLHGLQLQQDAPQLSLVTEDD